MHAKDEDVSDRADRRCRETRAVCWPAAHLSPAPLRTTSPPSCGSSAGGADALRSGCLTMNQWLSFWWIGRR